MGRSFLLLWRFLSLTCMLSSISYSTAQSYSMPPQAPPIRPPTQQRPGAVPGQPTGPEFKDIATEKLLLKPLSDGKVAAHFEFDYLNKNGVPRDPRTLGNKDKGMYTCIFVFMSHLGSLYVSLLRPALRVLPYDHGPNPSRICSCRNAPNTKYWKMEL